MYEKVAAVGVKFFKPRPQHASVTVYVVTFLNRSNLVYLQTTAFRGVSSIVCMSLHTY